jgi:hypothetical protein
VLLHLNQPGQFTFFRRLLNCDNWRIAGRPQSSPFSRLENLQWEDIHLLEDALGFKLLLDHSSPTRLRNSSRHSQRTRAKLISSRSRKIAISVSPSTSSENEGLFQLTLRNFLYILIRTAASSKGVCFQTIFADLDAIQTAFLPHQDFLQGFITHRTQEFIR